MVPALIGPLAAGLILTVSPSSIYKVSTSGTGTTPAASVSVIGGQSPYTYAWTKVSGSSGLSVTSASSSSTTFTYIFNSDGIMSASFKCVVTDSLGASSEVFINVSVSFFSDLEL